MGTWDRYKTDEDKRPGYVELKKAGDTFRGTLVSVKPKVIPSGTFEHQPADLTVPSLEFRTDRGRTVLLDATNTVLKNELVASAPEPGDVVEIERGEKPRGKAWIPYTVRVSPGGSTPKASEPEDEMSPEGDEVPF